MGYVSQQAGFMRKGYLIGKACVKGIDELLIPQESQKVGGAGF